MSSWLDDMGVSVIVCSWLGGYQRVNLGRILRLPARVCIPAFERDLRRGLSERGPDHGKNAELFIVNLVHAPRVCLRAVRLNKLCGGDSVLP